MRNQPEGRDTSPIVSVIVPCYNSERTIRACLRSIINQRTSVPFDIIVVDSSSDSTPQIVESEFPSVRLIHLSERTFAGAARNIGARSTKSEYLMMIDSDCLARPDVIERAINRHREDQFAAVGGSLRNGTPRSLSGWISYLIEFKEYMPTAPERTEKTVPTANVAYRREVFERYGGFDDDMWLAEDILFNWKMHSAGERILFDPAIEVTHLNRTGWKEVLSYQINLGRCSAQARKRAAMPGGVLVRFPALILLMPFVRLFNAVRWLAGCDLRALMVLIALSPMYLLAAAFWSYGFFRGATDRSQSEK
ncbi:MAG TPA: glycosyltransferase [Blastocatellia bacterium]|jgi:glycosyltransferase involved in cell wall biosynthesis